MLEGVYEVDEAVQMDFARALVVHGAEQCIGNAGNAARRGSVVTELVGALAAGPECLRDAGPHMEQ